MPYARESWLVAGLLALLVACGSSSTSSTRRSSTSATRAWWARTASRGSSSTPQRDPRRQLRAAQLPRLRPVRAESSRGTAAWGALPAAHAAAITFDLLTVRRPAAARPPAARRRAEGRTLGLALAYAWAAYPYSTYVLQSNTNDGLVAMLLVCALLAISLAGGAAACVLGLAAAAKFAPLALAPLFAAGTGDRRPRSLAALRAARSRRSCVGRDRAFLPRRRPARAVGHDDRLPARPRDAVQPLGACTPRSSWVQRVAKVGRRGALLRALAFVPRRRDLRQVAALGGGGR